MKLFQLNCQNCNGSLEIDFDNLIAYCPYCGQKLLFDLDQMKSIITEIEKTKRSQEQTKREQEKTERLKLEQDFNKYEIKTTVKIAFGCFGLVALLFLLLELLL